MTTLLYRVPSPIQPMFPSKGVDNTVVVTEFPHEIVDEPTVWVTMSDSARLAARIWRPIGSDNQPVPAVLNYIPYRRREGMLYDDEMMYPWFAGHGIACVRVDIRGSGDSAGEQPWQRQCDCTAMRCVA